MWVVVSHIKILNLNINYKRILKYLVLLILGNFEKWLL